MINSKFFPLEQYLKNSSLKIVNLSFKDIEEILGFHLCDSAYKYREYWSLCKTHILPRVVEEAGFFIGEVNMNTQKVVFRKK